MHHGIGYIQKASLIAWLKRFVVFIEVHKKDKSVKRCLKRKYQHRHRMIKQKNVSKVIT